VVARLRSAAIVRAIKKGCMRILRNLACVLLCATWLLYSAPGVATSGCDVDWTDIDYIDGSVAWNTCNSYDCDSTCWYFNVELEWNGPGCTTQYTGHGAPQCGSPYGGPSVFYVDGWCSCGY
jgi:hypothetical protein